MLTNPWHDSSVRWELQKCHCKSALVRSHLEYHVQDQLSILKKDKIELERGAETILQWYIAKLESFSQARCKMEDCLRTLEIPLWLNIKDERIPQAKKQVLTWSQITEQNSESINTDFGRKWAQICFKMNFSPYVEGAVQHRKKIFGAWKLMAQSRSPRQG